MKRVLATSFLATVTFGEQVLERELRLLRAPSRTQTDEADFDDYVAPFEPKEQTKPAAAIEPVVAEVDEPEKTEPEPVRDLEPADQTEAEEETIEPSHDEEEVEEQIEEQVEDEEEPKVPEPV